MIVDERMVAYINSLDVGNSALVNEIEEEALATFVPIIRKEMQNFLKVILEIKRPKAILEVGTAIGFSALLMSEHVDADCKITTIEKYEPRHSDKLSNAYPCVSSSIFSHRDDLL